jgi:hypothetical protein
MKRLHRRAVLIVAIFALLALAHTAAAQGKDALQGTWTQNMAKSTCTAATGSTCAAAPQVTTTRKYDDLGNGWVAVANDGINAAGMPNGNRIVARRDGKDYAIAGRSQPDYVTIAFTVKSTRPYSADYNTKLGGKITSNATETLSADGKMLTITVKNMNPATGQPTTSLVQVWDRQ